MIYLVLIIYLHSCCTTGFKSFWSLQGVMHPRQPLHLASVYFVNRILPNLNYHCCGFKVPKTKVQQLLVSLQLF